MIQKFLDQEGLKVLWSKISMEDYPNNETLMAVIEAIDETKITAPANGTVGQILIVKEVNENGVPIAWECKDIETGEITQIQSDWEETDETSLAYIKNKPEIATDDEIIEMLAQEDLLPVVTDSDGGILADENDNILLW